MDILGQVDIEMTAQLLQKKNTILNVHGTFFKKLIIYLLGINQISTSFRRLKSYRTCFKI